MAEGILAKMAYRNLRRHLSRSILAAVGIVIGVVAVTTIGILGTSMQITVSAQLSSLASDVIIYPASNYAEYLSEKQLRVIEKVPVEGETIAIKQDVLDKVQRGIHSDSFRASAFGIDLEKAKGLWYLEEGKWPTGTRDEITVGYRFADRNNLRVGSSLYLNDEPYRIVGIIEEQQGTSSIMVNPNNAVVMSSNLFNRIMDVDGYSYVILRVKSMSGLSQAKDYLESRLNKKEDTANIMVMSDMINSFESVFGMMALILTAIGAISLVVAGISILNVMLMSVLERTKEIGIMRAIGSYRGEVTRMFVYETLILGVIASFVGMIFSLLGGYVANTILLTRFFPPRMLAQTGLSIESLLFSPGSLTSIAEGFAIGMAVTFASGLYPAYRAARMPPMEALRYE